MHLMLCVPWVILSDTITVLMPASCYYMTSFNYGGKKAIDVGLTCRCHLSNIMPESIFYDSLGWGMTQFFSFLRDGNYCLLQHIKDRFRLITITQWVRGNLKGCVRYIFTSLFCVSKTKDLWNKEKCSLFHFKSSFRSWDNQILNFQIARCHDVIKFLSMKHETRFIE